MSLELDDYRLGVEGGDQALEGLGVAFHGTGTDFLGTAICVSDIQVTLSDGETVDCLQKMYPVARNVVAGFAGDVSLGFSMLNELALLLHETQPGSSREAMDEFSGVPGRASPAARTTSRPEGANC
jgi:hypothetical protein